MQIRLETQGSDVTIDDLGGVTFVDPSTTTLYDSTSQTNPFSLDDLRDSVDLQSSIDASDIVIKDEDDNEYETILSIVDKININQNNYVVINTLSDFPAASGGKITLLPSTKYFITGSIVIGTDYIEMSENTTLEGVSGFVAQIIYTGSGGAIRGTDVTCSINSITFVASGVSGKVFDLSNAANTKTFVLQQCIIANSTEIGSVDGFNIVLIDIVNHVNNSDGWTFTDNTNLFLLDTSFSDDNGGTFVDLSSGTFDNVIISRCNFEVGGGDTGLDIDYASITVTNSINIFSNVFSGAGTLTTGFDVDDVKINVKSNGGLANFTAGASMYWEDVTGTMSLASSDGYKKITGNTSSGANLKRFSHTSPNRLTYNGIEDISAKVNVSLAAYYTTGGAFIASIAVAKNGTVVTGSGSGFTIYSADEPCGTDVQLSLSNGDYIEVFIKKFVGRSTNIVVSFLNVQVNELS